MIEKVKRVSNPLTIIAIFSALAETAGTIALPLVNNELQKFFIWYVMGLPVLLVVSFFLTLNFNPNVLYSPSDFENEDNFMDAVLKHVRIDNSYKSIEEKFLMLKEEINTIPKQNNTEELLNSLNNKIDSLNTIVMKTKNQTESANDVIQTTKGVPQSALQAKVYSYLLTNGEKSTEEIIEYLGMSKTSIQKVLNRLKEDK